MMERKIVVHHTGGRRSGFCKCEPHYLIAGRWGIFEGDRVYEKRKIGDDKEIHIALKGNYRYATERERPTKEQWRSLIGLIVENCRKFEIPAHEVYGHSELDKETSCPGVHVNLGRLYMDVRENTGVKEEHVAMNNLRLMKSKEMGGMIKTHSEEVTIIPDVERFADFHYNSESGLVRYFGKWQTTPDIERAIYAFGHFPIVFDDEKEIKIDKEGLRLQRGTTEIARERIEESIELFNEGR